MIHPDQVSKRSRCINAGMVTCDAVPWEISILEEDLL